MRLISLRGRAPHDAVLARAIWSVRHGSVHPLVREGVALTESVRTGLIRAGVVSVWVEDEVSAGIEPRPPLSEEVRIRASSALADMFGRTARGGPGGRIAPAQLDSLGCVVEAILAEVRDSRAVLGAMADLQTVDGETVSHSLNVTVLGLVVGRRAMREHGWHDWRGGAHREIDLERLAKLGLGLMLHDVGKAHVPREILTKPSALSQAEMALIREHPRFGAEMLDESGISPLSRVVVLDHHERMDGSGYPAGKPSERIHEHARIAAIVDTYDAAAARRPYGPQRSSQAAWELVRILGRDGLLDPRLADLFARTVAPYPEGTEVELVDGRRGLVARVDETELDRPVVRVLQEDGRDVAAYDVDLRSDRDARIRDAVFGASDGSGASRAARLADDLQAAA